MSTIHVAGIFALVLVVTLGCVILIAWGLGSDPYEVDDENQE